MEAKDGAQGKETMRKRVGGQPPGRQDTDPVRWKRSRESTGGELVQGVGM